MGLILGLSGPEIEALSMEIIEKELGPTDFSYEELQIVKRVIHATADFEFARNIRFHPDAIKRGLKSLKEGRIIVTDTRMGASGISISLLKRGKDQVAAPISWEKTRQLAKAKSTTLSECAMELSASLDPGILVIGNAPTALLKAIELVNSGRLSPELIIGVPVGFVNAKESKEELIKLDTPFITVLGRKGGTPVGVAIINALIRLSLKGA